jgi:hypothetical protein
MMTEDTSGSDDVEYDACVHPHTNDTTAINEIILQREEWSKFLAKNNNSNEGIYYFYHVFLFVFIL